jgi:hypothetical protein
MFPVIPYNEELREAYCKKTWGINIQTEWPAVQYWGRDIKSSSNIVFSNGVYLFLYQILCIYKNNQLFKNFDSCWTHGTVVDLL